MTKPVLSGEDIRLRELLKLPASTEVAETRKAVLGNNDIALYGASRLERLAVFLTKHIGTMTCFLLLVGLTTVWMSWNVLASAMHWPGMFDAPWGFAVWLFICNLLQIWFLPLIMVGQNLLGRRSETLAEQHDKEARQTGYEMEVVIRYLEAIKALLENEK